MVVEVTVTNPEYWSGERALQLAQLLRTAGENNAAPTIADPTGKPADPENLFVISDPGHWATEPQQLQEILAAAGTTSPIETSETLPGDAAGAVPGSPGRLTMTVEEAAAALGISRAFAYEAVTRNEIPHVRIGRRILIPRAALERMLGDAGTTAP